MKHLLQVINGGKRRNKDVEYSVDSLDFHAKVLHSAWHPKDNIIG